MKPILISIAGLTFETTLSWQFIPYESFILAKSDSGIGVFKFNFSQVNILNKMAPNQILSQVIKTYLIKKDAKSIDRKVMPGRDFQSGNETFFYEDNKSQLYLKIWFKKMNEILFTAGYGCRWDHYKENLPEREIQECDRMVTTMRLSKK
jgi:hypothetical protein